MKDRPSQISRQLGDAQELRALSALPRFNIVLEEFYNGHNLYQDMVIHPSPDGEWIRYEDYARLKGLK